MIKAGYYQTLTIARISDHGLYLTDSEGEEVLLPNRYVSLADKVDEKIEVFVYHDSENRLIATREHPKAKVGEAAWLEVVDKNIHGAFLDWGITAKDLFLPNANQIYPVEAGKHCIVYLYADNITSRVVATTKLNSFINNETVTVRAGEQVDVLIARRLSMGFRVIVNNRYWGVIYDNQLFAPVRTGDRVTGYVRRITEDNRIDVSLQQQGLDEVRRAVDKLQSVLEQSGGKIALTDDSSPEEVRRALQMSKKVFKRALGYMLSHTMVRSGEGVTELIEKKAE